MLILRNLYILIEKSRAIKNQALVELLKYSKHEAKEVLLVEEKQEWWVLCFDGASSHNQGSAGIILSNNHGEIFKKAIMLAFPYSNNEVEYEALAIGLDFAKEMKISKLKVCGDLTLVIKQLNRYFAVVTY